MAAPGKKPGAPKTGGRKKGTPNARTTELKALALLEAPDMFKELARIAKSSDNDGTRVSAIKEIFDRAYGRPAQAITGEGGGPIEISTMFAEISSLTGLLPSDDEAT